LVALQIHAGQRFAEWLAALDDFRNWLVRQPRKGRFQSATHCGKNAPTASGDDGFAAILAV
jgi:hypothetical protein